MTNILVLAAHPDDEVLGCGGSIARHAAKGAKVSILFLADGCSSRDHDKEAMTRRREAANYAATILGANLPMFLDYPDNKLDTIPFLDIVKSVEQVLQGSKFDIVFTHHGGDLNIDHRICHQVALTAFRPAPGQSVIGLYGFEVPSSTEWAFGTPCFVPTSFTDITKFQAHKHSALKAYHEEMRDWPHPRSYRAVETLNSWRGSCVGIESAEAFQTIREII